MKRKIRFQFEGRTYQVEVERNGDQLTVEREGECFTVTLFAEERPNAGASTAGVPAAPAASPVPAAALPKPERRTAAAAKAQSAPAAGALFAPMTGLIKEIKVSVGYNVKKGQVVLVMEAMKMDVEVSAPATGVVAEIPVQAGESVESQQLLMIIQ